MNVLERMPQLCCTKCLGKLALAGGELLCENCNSKYQIKGEIPYLITEDMAEFAKEIAVQDKVAIEYEQKRYQVAYAKQYHNWWTDQMLAKVKTNGKILDNGCGVGLLHERLDSTEIVGLDLSSEMLKRAKTHYDKLVLANSQKLPFKDESFDLVFCRSILHHLPKPELAVEQMSRVLKPNGEIVLVETNASILSTLPRKIANKGEHFSEEHQNMSKAKMKELLEPYFEIDEICYFGYIAYPTLGFPDLVGFYKYVPLKSLFTPVLMAIDKVLSLIPLVRSQSWAILVKATVKKN